MSSLERLRVVIYNDADMWVAQALEHDIGVQAADLISVKERFDAAYNLEREDSIKRAGKPFADIEPAPQFFFDLWEKSSKDFRATDEPYEMALCA